VRAICSGGGDTGSPTAPPIPFWSRYRAVIFDCDDTILATRRVRWSVLRKTARDLGREVSEAQLRANWGRPFDDLIKALVPGIELQPFVRAYEEAMELHPPRATPGAKGLLHHLSRLGVRMHVLTSGSRRLILRDLGRLGLDRYFASVYAYEDSTHWKPDPRAFDPVLRALKQEGYALCEILSVGDSSLDCQAAQGAGLDFAAVTTGLDGSQIFLELGLPPGRVFATLAALMITVSRDRPGL